MRALHFGLGKLRDRVKKHQRSKSPDTPQVRMTPAGATGSHLNEQSAPQGEPVPLIEMHACDGFCGRRNCLRTSTTERAGTTAQPEFTVLKHVISVKSALLELHQASMDRHGENESWEGEGRKEHFIPSSVHGGMVVSGLTCIVVLPEDASSAGKLILTTTTAGMCT